MIMVVVMIGGALGSAARYLVGATFPHGTVIVRRQITSQPKSA